MKRKVSIAIAGCTGAVGREAISILNKRSVLQHFGEIDLRLFASASSSGLNVTFHGESYPVCLLEERSLIENPADVVLFTAGSEVSRKLAPPAAKAGSIVIDNSSAFRMSPDVPLIIPEINAHLLADIPPGEGAIIANPNCSTILLAVVTFPLACRFGIEHMVVSTYQAVSGAGAAAMQELQQQTQNILAGQKATPRIFTEPCAFNVFSHDSAVDVQTGLNEEESKIIKEMKKIFSSSPSTLNTPGITCTCIRVPVFRAHCESVNLAFSKPVTVAEIRETLKQAPSVTLRDDRQQNDFPTPLKAENRDEVFAGRIRLDPSRNDNRGADLFLCGDQLRKGAALNALQIAEIILRNRI